MDLWNFILDVLMLLGAAFVAGAVAERLKQSAIIGYLLAGAILGPVFFQAEALMNIAELGVALLLFSIGLEFSFRRLKSLGAMAIWGGIIQVCLTLGLAALFFSLFFTAKQAIALGAMVALSSTAVVLRLLTRNAEIDSTRGRNALGILLLQDIALVPLVLTVTILGAGGGFREFAIEVGKALAAAAGLGVVFYLIFYHLVPRILLTRELRRNRELVNLLTLVVAVGSAWASHAVGLSPSLGAFLAGILLAESPFATQIRSDIGLIRTVFITLFFLSIGMLTEPMWLLQHLPLVLAGVALVFVGKVLVVYLIGMIFKNSHRDSLATGITLGQVGEFSFVLATVAVSGKLIDQDIFSLAVSVTIFLLFLAPYMVNGAYPLADRVLARLMPGRSKTPKSAGNKQTEANNIFIIGFGPAGQQVAKALADQSCPPVVIEQNPISAKLAKGLGFKTHVGDGTHEEILEHAGISGSCLSVVTVPDSRTAAMVIKNIRAIAPESTIIARSRYHRLVWELQEAGADLVADEEYQVGLALADQVLSKLSTGTLSCSVPLEKESEDQ